MVERNWADLDWAGDGRVDTSKGVHSRLCPSSGPGRTERDATSWSKGMLRELLVGITVENEAGWCEISELKQVEGEASCSSRKGKLIFFYEWNIKLGWKGNRGLQVLVG